jgi:predicted transcriptional regulator
MLEKLAPRERQIVDVLYARGEATAEQVRDALKNPPGNSAIRAMLVRLETKGFVTHREVDNRYVYAPSVSEKKARESALQQLLGTFFNNSPARAATALLGMVGKVDKRELDEALRKTRSERRL